MATSPASLETSLLEFFHRLRDARVPVSMVEVLDAFDCLRHVELADRAQFRAALAATLIKRAEDRATFDVLFDVCFPPTRAAPEPAAASGALLGGGNGEPAARVERGGAPDGQPSTDLLEALLDALRQDDEAAMAALAGLAVDRYGGMEGELEGTERYFMYRIMRQLELYRLIQTAMARRLAPEATETLDDRLERERLQRRLEEFRRMLAERVRHRLADRTGAAGAAELYRQRQLDEVDFLGASTTQLDELRQAVRPLARKLAARVAAKRRRRRRGRLDVRRTVRRSLQYGGVPVEPAFRARHATRPDLFVLADVSGSVVEFAEFTLSLLYAMSRELGRLRSFAFVDGIDELTGLLAESERGLDLRATFARAAVVADDGHSHYGQVLERFTERYGTEVDSRSTLIVMGDARANYRDPGVEALRQLRARARRVYWLNPEPRRDWDTMDSVMGLFAPHCDRVFEVANLRQLADCVYQIS
ncbi:MAG TPA: VWA domain-containing protein [Actinomycetota bacterium]